MLDGLEVEEAISQLAAAMGSFGADTANALATLLRDPRGHVREAAVHLCEQVQDPALLQPLTSLAIDEVANVRRIATRLLGSYAGTSGYRRAMGQLRFVAAEGERLESERRRAIAALSRLRDEASVRLLAELLTEPERAVAAAARVGLRVITGHDFGFARDPWLRWFAKQEQSGRTQWLIDGLGDARAHLRALASRELAQLTGLRAALPESATRAAFVAEQREYQSWWAGQRRAR
jgi:HEAT repeat protein